MSEGFFASFEDAPAGASYIKKEERHELIRSGVVLTITKVLKQPDSFNPGKQRYLCVVDLGGEERLLNFGEDAGSRGAMLESMIQYFEKEDSTPIDVRIETVGQNGYQILVEA